MKIQLLPTHHRDLLKRRPAKRERERDKNNLSTRPPFSPPAGGRLVLQGRGWKLKSVGFHSLPPSSPSISPFSSPSAVVKLPQLVQESESLSPMVWLVFASRICHVFEGFRKGWGFVSLKKNPIEKQQQSAAPPCLSRDPGSYARPGISHGEGLVFSKKRRKRNERKV